VASFRRTVGFLWRELPDRNRLRLTRRDEANSSHGSKLHGISTRGVGDERAPPVGALLRGCCRCNSTATLRGQARWHVERRDKYGFPRVAVPRPPVHAPRLRHLDIHWPFRGRTGLTIGAGTTAGLPLLRVLWSSRPPTSPTRCRTCDCSSAFRNPARFGPRSAGGHSEDQMAVSPTKPLEFVCIGRRATNRAAGSGCASSHYRLDPFPRCGAEIFKDQYLSSCRRLDGISVVARLFQVQRSHVSMNSRAPQES
jgi:hypothetical protein